MLRDRFLSDTLRDLQLWLARRLVRPPKLHMLSLPAWEYCNLTQHLVGLTDILIREAKARKRLLWSCPYGNVILLDQFALFCAVEPRQQRRRTLALRFGFLQIRLELPRIAKESSHA